MAHQYSTLLYADSIRLLKLLPASNDADDCVLSCGLEDCRLSDDPSYEALSYTWGQPIFPEILHTDNGVLKITENLALALRRLRFKERVRYLWIDAVCINQNDATDKSRQVAMMGSIYKSARRVICWLGQADESINDAMETLKRLAASASRFGITEVFHGWKRTTTLSGHTKAQEDAFKELAQTTDFSALAKLYRNPYFTRLWIIQEIALAQKAVLTVKPWSITYDDFAMATAVLHNLLHTFSTDCGSLEFKTLSNAWDIVTTKLAYTKKQNRDVLTDAELAAVNDDLWRPDWMSLRLLDLIDTINSKCFDPRDQIYGLLSLSNDDIDLTADYSKSASEVYADFAKAYLVQGHIRILNLAGLQRINQNRTSSSPLQVHTSSSDTVPSWAPDWRAPKPYMALGGSNRPGFTAGFNLPKNIETTPTNPSKILISGIHIDTIAHIRRPIALDPAHAKLSARFSTHEPTRASIAALRAFCESHYQNTGMTQYATGENILTAFVRTVLADGVYKVFRDLFPIMKEPPERMVLLWRIFETLKIKPDDTIDLALHMDLLSFQTGELGQGRAQSVRTAWLILMFMVTAISNHAVFITVQGYLGLGPALTDVGDRVVIFGGSETPFVLRENGSAGDDDGAGKEFCILGDCYLHGFMYGELLTEEHRAAGEMFGIV